MSMRIRCPNGHMLEMAEELRGRKVRCPNCKTVLTAEPEPPAPQPASMAVTEVQVVEDEPPRHSVRAEEDDPPRRRVRDEEDERPRRRIRDEEDDFRSEYDDDIEFRPKPKKMKKAQRMRLTRLGLALHAAKIICYLVALVLVLVLFSLSLVSASILMSSNVSPAGTGRSGPGSGVAVIGVLILVLGGVAFLLSMAAPFLCLAGSVLCLWVPEKSGSKVLIMLSCALDAMGLLIYAGCFLLSLISGSLGSVLPGRASMAGAAVNTSMVLVSQLGALLSLIMIFVAWVLFMLFLRQLFYYCRDRSGADECLQVMFLCIGWAILGPIIFFIGLILLGVIAAKTHVGVAIAGAVILIIVFIVVWVKLLFSVLQLISTLRGYMSKW
jgi:hypothetical protein